jgi:hypothetical protein
MSKTKHEDINAEVISIEYDQEDIVEMEDFETEQAKKDFGDDIEDDGNTEIEDCDEVAEVDEVDDTVIDKIVTNSYSADEYRAFNEINRDEEDSLVCQYIKTKDSKIMLKLLIIREQTLRYMAKKYSYLENEDDMYSIFKEVWLKCLKKYDGGKKVRQARNKGGALLINEDGTPQMVDKKTPFNTYLYTSMKNRALNIFKRRNSKRLLDDDGKPVADSIRSLDYEYGDEGDMTLMNLIPDEKSEKAYSRAELSDLIIQLGADKDTDIARAIDTFINNPRFETLTAACNYRVGTLRTTKWDKNILSLGKVTKGIEPTTANVKLSTTYLKKMVDSTGTFHGKYEIVNFVLNQNRVDFVAHMDDPKVLKKVKEAILKCRASISSSR